MSAKGADIFHPQERAILFDYFGLERPEALQGMEVFASVAGEDDPAQPVLIEPDADGERSSYGIANAVARLLLVRIQSRLPQWVGRQDGEIVLGRKHRKAKTRPVEPLPQFLFEINWASSGPGFSWPESYNVIYVPGFGRFVVTASRDSADLIGYTDIAIGWFPEGTEILEGAKRTILEWWEEFSSRDYEPWEAVLGTGLMDEADAVQWRDELWRREEEEDDNDDHAPIEYSSRGIPITSVTVLVRRSAIESGYSGGFAQFRQRYPGPLAEDEKLVGIVSKSMEEAERVFEALKQAGVDMDGAGALADIELGPVRAARGVAFQREEGGEDPLVHRWRALALDERATKSVSRRAMIEMFEQAISRACDRVCPSSPPPTSYAAGVGRAMRRNAIRSFLEDYVAKHGRLPAGEHKVPSAGTIHFSKDSPIPTKAPATSASDPAAQLASPDESEDEIRAFEKHRRPRRNWQPTPKKT